MAFLGNTPSQQAFTPAVDYFNGTGSATAFTLSRPVASVAQVQVTIENVPQNPSSAFTVSGSTITFTSAPPSGTSNVYVTYTSPITQVIAPGQGTVTATSMSSSTGTGAGVFQTSPTITTPTISSLSSASATALTLQSAGTTAITVDTSQNVGIGTTSPAVKLDIIGSSGQNLRLRNGTVATEYYDIGRDGADGILAFNGAQSSPYVGYKWSTTSTERMRIDSSGNVGIGTSAPLFRLNAVQGSGSAASSVRESIQIYARGYAGSSQQYAGIGFAMSEHTNGYWGSGILSRDDTGSYGAALAFYTSTGSATPTPTERMRIDSSGTVLMGQTTNPATGTLVLKVPTGTGNGVNAQITSNTGTSYPFSNYNASSTYVGGISCTSSATAFPTSSDVRLKKNITDAPSAISKVLTAKVVSHDWINDGHHVEYGFVAQDLQDTIPQAVIEGTDKEDGSMNMPWGVDYSKIVPLLVKCIQEQQALITQLQTQITALNAKVGI